LFPAVAVEDALDVAAESLWTFLIIGGHGFIATIAAIKPRYRLFFDSPGGLVHVDIEANFLFAPIVLRN
jgi:hypothetical protein